MTEKLCIIMRGIPGSGKSYVVKQAMELYSNVKVCSCSADNFFMINGEYRFDVSKLSVAHADCLKKFIHATMYAKDEVVIVDNTNIHVWEMENYIRIAKCNGYKVIVFSCMPKDKEELKICVKRQTHGVPLEIMLRMWFEIEPCTLESVDKIVHFFNPSIDQIKQGLIL